MKKSNSYFLKYKGAFYMLLIADMIEAVGLIEISWFLSQVFAVVESESMEKVPNLILLGIGVVILYVLAEYFQEFARRGFLKKVDTHLRKDVFSSIIKKDFKDFGEKNTGEYISIMNNHLEKMEDNYLIQIPYIVETFILSVFSALFLFTFSVEMALIIIVSACIPILVPVFMQKVVSQKTNAFMEGMSHYNIKIKDMFGGYEVIKSFRAEKQIEQVHLQALENMEETKYRYREANAWIKHAMTVSTYFILVLQYVMGAYLITTNQVTLAAVMGALNLGNTVNNQFRECAGALVIAKGIKDVKAGIDVILQNANTQSGEKEHLLEEGDICLKNVDFSHDGERTTIKDVSFTFKKGKKYAIVGGSGAGKSTLVKLIMQYYTHYTGSITYANKDVKDIAKELLYDEIAMIHQKVFLFDDTVKNNVTMHKNYNEEELQYAIEKSGLSEIVKNREGGIEYFVGDGGNHLSGGEQQRIAIARALLKKAKVLILDEATSSLDREMAIKIENTVLEQENTTTIVVTHKLEKSILKKYDGILVMHKGKLAEVGTFEELMNKKGKFYSLYMLQ